MKLLKENKIIILWGAFALAMAFHYFNEPINTIKREKLEPDSLIYFSFTSNQKNTIDSLFTQRNKYFGFNGTVLIGEKDSIFYLRHFGYANLKKKDSLTTNHSFQLASVSKQFTAVAILQLYEKGLLDLNDTLQVFFPEFPYKDITIHQLLVHRSGLPNYHYFFQHIATTYDTVLFNSDVITEMIEKNPAPYYRPNQRYHYSNTGYAILAAIVEKVSGLKFNEYLKKNIFSPLKMHHSFSFLDINEKQLMATGYLKYNKEAEDNYLDYVLGDKGVYCSAEDLFKWDQGLYKNTIINKDTLELAFLPMGKPLYFKSNYGYGWRMLDWGADSTKVLFHAGWWHGFKSLLLRIPEDSATIIVLRNRTVGGSVSSKRILKILYPKHTSTDTTDLEL